MTQGSSRSPGIRPEVKSLGGYSSLEADLVRGRTFSTSAAAAPAPARPLAPTHLTYASPPAGPAPGALAPPLAAPGALAPPLAAPGALALPLAAPAPALPAADPSALAERALAGGALSASNCPAGPLVAPGGVAAGGRGSLAVVQRWPDGPVAVHLQVEGLRPVPPQQAQYCLWLLYDLTVPADLPAEDLSLLPKGPGGNGNAAGAVFTLDGGPPAVMTAPNTVTISVLAGSFTTAPNGTASERFDWTDATPWCMHPLTALGPAAAGTGINLTQPVPSGVVRQILTDVFLHRASRFVTLPLASAFPQRLLTAAAESFAQWDADRNGVISLSDVAAAGPGAFLAPAEFNRVAVTLEPVAHRSSPLLAPTRQTCVLAGELQA